MRFANIWQTSAPSDHATQFADFQSLQLEPPTGKRVKSLKKVLKGLEEKVGERVENLLAELLDRNKSEAWETAKSKDCRFWVALENPPSPDPSELSVYLAKLACDDRSEKGYLAKGLVRRVGSPRFNGNPSVYNQEFRNCPAAKNAPSSLMAGLRKAVERYQQARAKRQVKKPNRSQT